MRRRLTFALAFLFVVAALGARPAAADSFLTSISFGSVQAKQVRTADDALAVIQKNPHNVAVGMDVVRAMRLTAPSWSDSRENRAFRLGLAKLAKSGNPVFELLRGVNLVANNSSSRRGVTAVRKSAAKLPYDSAAQLAVGLVVAQRDAFNGRGSGGLAPDRGSRWGKRTPLKREAARHINRARQLESGTSHPRRLVRTALHGLTTSTDIDGKPRGYVGNYKGYKGLIHRTRLGRRTRGRQVRSRR